MTLFGSLQIVVFFILLLLVVKPLGGYMARVYAGESTFLTPLLRKFENRFYRAAGIHPEEDMTWKVYAFAVLGFSLIGIVFLYILQRFQNFLPLNPQGFGPVAPDLALNSAVSFVTNTNWQNFGGETTMSFLTQMIGFTVQNFLSAATGMAVLMALIRGFARASMKTVGNFWVDITRCTLYVLLPICIVYTLFLIWQGMPQTLGAYVDATTLEGAKHALARVA
ncbi:MAG: hypothetical protein HGA86_07890 [Anaerolineaceae bacterium]|nr:hypothetical protein [Anaerolineaceae bacterium]